MNLQICQVRRRHCAVLFCLSGLLLVPSPALLSAADEGVYSEGRLVYKQVDGVELHMDWTKPADWKSGDQRPAVVFFHGGGWVSGKPGQFLEHSRELARLGMVCLRVEYRLLDRKSNVAPKTCTEDARDAFAYVRRHAKELGIAPNRIAAAGGSAGGHLAAYLGMVEAPEQKKTDLSLKPNALLLFNPVYDNGPGGWGTGRVGEEYPKYSPLHNISAGDPPAIVFLGTNDNLIPVSTAKSFQQKMRAVGIQSELHLYEGQPHGFFNYGRDDGKWYRATMKESKSFLQSLGWLD